MAVLTEAESREHFELQSTLMMFQFLIVWHSDQIAFCFEHSALDYSFSPDYHQGLVVQAMLEKAAGEVAEFEAVVKQLVLLRYW